MYLRAEHNLGVHSQLHCFVVKDIVAVGVNTSHAWLSELATFDLGADELADTVTANIFEVFTGLLVLVKAEAINRLGGRAHCTLALRLWLFLLRWHLDLDGLLGYWFWLENASSVDLRGRLPSICASRPGLSACSWRIIDWYEISASP